MGACDPSWGPPPGEEAVPASEKEAAADFCPALAAFADQRDLAQAVSFPHDLPDVSASAPAHPPGYRSTVRDVFEARGFHYLSNASTSSVVGIGKRLTDSSSLQLSLDVGTWSVSASAILFVSIEDRYAAFRLPPSLRAAQRGQYPMIDEAQWRMLLENHAASVELIEQHVLECAEQRAAADTTG